MMKDYAQRKHIRLKQHDYAGEGVYFITFCTYQKEWLLSRIVGRGALTPPQVELTEMGKIVDEVIENTEAVYPYLSVENYVIMPNHVHLLLRFSRENGGLRAARPTVSEVVKGIKGIATRKIGFSIWQTGFYDHIIRDEQDYWIRFRYIEENPAKWQQDQYYCQEV